VDLICEQITETRFRKLFLPRYTEEQYLRVAEIVLPTTSPSIARYIGEQFCGGDIRDVVSIGRLVHKTKYGEIKED